MRTSKHRKPGRRTLQIMKLSLFDICFAEPISAQGSPSSSLDGTAVILYPQEALANGARLPKFARRSLPMSSQGVCQELFWPDWPSLSFAV